MENARKMLLEAISIKDLPLVEKLLKEGADVSVLDNLCNRVVAETAVRRL